MADNIKISDRVSSLETKVNSLEGGIAELSEELEEMRESVQEEISNQLSRFGGGRA